MLLDLNAVMSIIANVPAAIASTVGSFCPFTMVFLDVFHWPDCCLPCRPTAYELLISRSRNLRVRTILGCPPSHMNVLCPRSNNATSLAFRSQYSQGHPIDIPPRKIVDGVHVQMNTFISPSESESVRSLKHYGDGSPDVTTMRGTKGVPPEESPEGFDVETQGTLKSPPFLWLITAYFPRLFSSAGKSKGIDDMTVLSYLCSKDVLLQCHESRMLLSTCYVVYKMSCPYFIVKPFR